MGFTSNLHILLLLRILQRMTGGVSTVGLIMVSSVSNKEEIPSNIGIFQSFLTLGQLLGPFLGVLMVITLGYKGSFMAAAMVLCSSLILCYLFVADTHCQNKENTFFGRTIFNKYTVAGWMLCFTATIHLMFLPAILPNVLERFNIEDIMAVKWAGIIVMLYTFTAMIGTYLWSRLSRKVGLYRMILYVVVLGSLFQALLALSTGILDFVIYRMIQTGLVAAAIPLTISMYASEQRGGVIGFLNSARFVGNGIGPILATSILAFTNFRSLYLFISGITIFALLWFKFSYQKSIGFLGKKP